MKNEIIISKRQFLKLGAYAGIGSVFPWHELMRGAHAVTLIPGLSDPGAQAKFINLAPNALDPDHRITPQIPLWQLKQIQDLSVVAAQYQHDTGLTDSGGSSLMTPVWGYGTGKNTVSWPGGTIEAFRNTKINVEWRNDLLNADNQPLPHLLPVDTTFHWCYSLHGYQGYTIENDGVPMVPHLHGGHTQSGFDGNPEYFFSPDWAIKGPRWESEVYEYDNDQEAGCLWYHDHALGMTRLNVYAGLAGFYIIRDEEDTGRHTNSLGLPAEQYELAYLIQDRMFRDTGELFYPAYPGEPAYEDFITGQGATLPPDLFPDGGPTGLAEFFGDHILVNGKLWPKADVEPRNYRMRLLNGSDSRFYALRFRIAESASSTDLTNASAPVPFWVIGSDQGLAQAPTQVDRLLMNPGERYDVVFDFTAIPSGSRVIMDNIAGDSPFGGVLIGDPGFDVADLFVDRQTDRIMAFDVTLPLSNIKDRFNPWMIGHYPGNTQTVDKVRKVALFEGKDQYGRLQPMLGTAEPNIDVMGNLVTGALPWHAPITENPALNSTEIWEIYNVTEDAHPVHLHLVNFEVLDREGFMADVIRQPVLQHDGQEAIGFRLEKIDLIPGTKIVAQGVEKAPKDMVTAFPGQVTRIKATFDRPGRYVWHCHILSHEDHDMMRPMHVGPLETSPYPTAQTDNVSTVGSGSIIIDPLANDTGIGLTLIAPNLWSLEGGNVVLANNKITYTPKPGFNGIDKIWYIFKDSQERTNSGVIIITVSGNDDSNSAYPSATTDTVTAPTGMSTTIDVLANDTGNGLVLSAPNPWSLKGGTVSLVDNKLVYTSKAGFTGNDNIWYTFADSLGRSTFGQVDIIVS